MSNSITPAANYKLVMESITLGTPVDKALFNMAVEYAKTSKRRAPKTENFEVEAVDTKAVKASEKAAAKEAKAAEKAVKAAVKEANKVLKSLEVKTCSEDDCETVAYAKGLCSKHYTATRRQDPCEKAKANEASRTYRARIAAIAAASVAASKI